MLLNVPDDQDQDGIPNPATFQNNNSRASRIPNVRILFSKGGAHLDPGEYKEWRREIAAINGNSLMSGIFVVFVYVFVLLAPKGCVINNKTWFFT